MFMEKRDAADEVAKLRETIRRYVFVLVVVVIAAVVIWRIQAGGRDAQRDGEEWGRCVAAGYDDC